MARPIDEYNPGIFATLVPDRPAPVSPGEKPVFAARGKIGLLKTSKPIRLEAGKRY